MEGLSAAGVRRLGVDGRVLDDRYHGIGRITAALLQQLARRPGLEVVVFVHPGQRSQRFDLGSLIEGAGFERAVVRHPLTSARQWLAWPGALRAARVDTALFPYHLGAPLWGSLRRVAVVHDCILEADPAFAPDRLTRLLYRALTALVVRRTKVVTPSRASADEVRRFYRVGPGAVEVVPWGVDAAFRRGGAGSDEPRPAGVPARYYLHVGARRPHKNTALFADLLRHLPEEDHVVVVGSPDERWPDALARRATELGVAHRVTQLADVGEKQLQLLYRGARAFLYPSLVEGFGLPLLEAMAAGAPVVASDIPVFREVAGDAALFVPAQDPRAWASALQGLEHAPARDALVTAGANRAAGASWESSGQRLWEALTAGGER